ncbi:competence protein CoiA [Thalassospira xiamenensis]|uniref:competence protein CoiA n=1 Tax=Thalassospira xiamenensis TaxID=220697 RepID=UPI0014832371|nr:competence protein CoiA family protein [Thalassospira xiamenensis]
MAPWLNAEEWENLRKARKVAGLRFNCCDSPVGMRISKYGVKHFYHLSKGECSSAGESEQHLYVKLLLADIARNAGWSVFLEEAGYTPDGQLWRADVLAKKGNVTIALEAQFSPQSEADYIARTKVYSDSGVRVCWFAGGKALRSIKHIIGKDHTLPLVGLNGDIENGFSVILTPYDDKLRPLSKWAGELINGEWKLGKTISVPASIVMVPKTCPCCRLLFGHQRTVACYPGDIDPEFGNFPVFVSPYTNLNDAQVSFDLKRLCDEASAIHGIQISTASDNQNTWCPKCKADVLWRDWTLDQLEAAWSDIDVRHGSVNVNFWHHNVWCRKDSPIPAPATGWDGERIGPLWVSYGVYSKRTLVEWFRHVKGLPQMAYQAHLRYTQNRHGKLVRQRSRERPPEYTIGGRPRLW